MRIDTGMVMDITSKTPNTDICDIHSHVLPGIDDGAKDWETSMEMLRLSYEASVRTVIATPHFYPWRGKLAPELVRDLCGEAQERFRQMFAKEIIVLPGEELFYSSELLNDMESGRCLTMNGTEFCLVEFSPSAPLSIIENGCHDIQVAGYKVILAHVERYEALRTKGSLERLLTPTLFIQSNIQEAFGQGKTSHWLKSLYKDKIIDFVASDMHNLSHRPPIEVGTIEKLRKKYGRDYTEAVLCTNAFNIIT